MAPRAALLRYTGLAAMGCQLHEEAGRIGEEVLEYSHFTAVGNRADNQDRLLVLADEPAGAYLFAVADGMGGHRAGAEAAQAAISAIEQCWAQRGAQQNPLGWLQEMTQCCHTAVVRLATLDEWSPPGATLAILFINSEGAWSAHVGDTRVMHYSPGGLQGRTRDHSATEMKLAAGRISAEEAATDADRNRVTRALGGRETPEASLRSWDPKVGDLMCVASDGAWSLLSDEDFSELREASRLRPALHTLMERRLLAAPAGQDNTTLIVLRK